MYTKKLIAREFRKNPTKSEKMFWQEIKKRKIYGLRFLRQYVIEGFIVDFYCPKLKLAIEIDGPIHLSNIKADKERMLVLRKVGVIFFRVSTESIEKDLENVIFDLKGFILNSGHLTCKIAKNGVFLK